MLNIRKRYLWLSIVFLIFIYTNTFAQDLNLCDVKHIAAKFAYEQSNKLWSEDDMIYRRASLFVMRNDTIAFNEGIYLFESGLSSIAKRCINKQNAKDIKYFSSALNDSFHSILDNFNTSVLNTKEGQYKSFNITLDVIFLGEGEVFIKKGNKFYKRRLNRYLVIKFNEIKMD